MRASLLARSKRVPIFPGILFLTLLAGCRESAATAADSGGQEAHSSASSLAWTSFQDPMEQAFSVEIPRGWAVRGGLFRMGYSDERPMVDIVSPDGHVNIRLGDLSIPVYTPPSGYHQREGEVVDLGAQAQLIVARYRPGPEFVVNYSHVRFYQNCPDAAADSEDVSFGVPDYLPSAGQPTQTSTGQIAYRCAGGQRIVYAFARTTLTGNIWTAPTLGSFVSTPEQVTLAGEVLRHCAETFHLNPQWIEKQKQMDAYALEYQRARQQQRLQALAAQVQQFEAKMQAMRDQVSAFERRQNAFNDQVQGFDQALRGVTPTIDPYTGEAREVWTGPKMNYWTNGTAVVNSTNGPAGWRQMQVTGP
jgi:hypothetical protein